MNTDASLIYLVYTLFHLIKWYLFQNPNTSIKFLSTTNYSNNLLPYGMAAGRT